MKIAHITTVFPPYKGGMGQVPFHLAQELHRRGKSVSVLTPLYAHGTADCDFDVQYMRPVLRWGLAALCPQVIWKLKSYDIVHLHYPAYGMAVFVWLWKKTIGRKKKLFVYYHMDNIASGMLGRVFSLYAVFFREMILRAADAVQVSTIDYIEHSQIAAYYTQHKQQFGVVPFGVTEDFVPGKKDAKLLLQHGIDVEKKIILFVGALGKAAYFKGPAILIQACAELTTHDWQLVFVGRGDMIEHYKQEAQNHGIANSVFFVGWQADAVLPQWYQAADIFCMPSINSSESFGIVYIEAMACGIPVIGTALPGVREVIKNNETGFVVEPGDVLAVSACLDNLLADDLLRNRIGDQAAEYAASTYTWAKVGDVLLRIYQQA